MIEFCDIFTLNTAFALGRPVDTGAIALGRGTVNLLGRWCTWYFKHHLLLLLFLLLLRSFVVLLLPFNSFLKDFSSKSCQLFLMCYLSTLSISKITYRQS